MNKQELIEKIGNLDKLYGETFYVVLDDVLDLVKQLDEPQPVKVLQFVAEWIEEARKTCKDVAELFEFDFTNDEVRKWFMQERPFDLVARAWLNGYEVDEEKRYLVKIKASNQYIMSNPDENAIFFYSCRAYSKLTRKELEAAGFGWVFDCPGIEIEEVEG